MEQTRPSQILGLEGEGYLPDPRLRGGGWSLEKNHGWRGATDREGMAKSDEGLVESG
jgi:hypothetical protein